MNKKAIEITVIYALVGLVSIKVYQAYASSTHDYSMPNLMLALLVGLAVGTIVNLIYFKLKKRG